ncbi:MAG: DUF1223 domain-containing protein [Alphaproteobacteria bacterium]|nr:MAG: DUF1223 domain-containing protein [Alphaproteobacteria bacterium]
MTSKILRLACIAVLSGMLLGGPGMAQGADQLTVVELFTSQGCSSCPPADRFLGELADRDDLLALSWNVDYWDYLGWRDTLARPQNTARQKAYNRAMGKSGVYTPQMIIDGRHEVVGSRRDEALALIENGQRKPFSADLVVTGSGPVRRIEIGSGTPDTPASVWLVGFDRDHRVHIQGGELGGKVMRYRNVVRESEQLATWTGKPTVVEIDLETMRERGRDACAIIIQEGDAGPILAALRFDVTQPE